MRTILFLFVLTVCVFGGGAKGDDETIKLGHDCDYQEDCESIPNAICNSQDVCECKFGYVNASDEKCLPQATKLGDSCEINEQCSNIPSAECVDKTCVVAQAVDIPTTTAKPKEECKQDTECSWFPIKRVCKNGTCVVDLPPIVPKAIDLDAFLLNKACANDSECSAEGSACIDKSCKCKENFVPSLNLKMCLQKAKSVGDKCVESSQCLLLDGSICENGKCSEKITKLLSGFGEKIGAIQIGSSCQTDNDCKHLTHAECRENVCQCTSDYVTSVSSNECLEKAKKEGDPCQIDKQCEDIKQATCLQGKCVKPGIVGTKLGKKNSGSRTVTSLTLTAIVVTTVLAV